MSHERFTDGGAAMMARVDAEIHASENLADLYANICDLAVGVGGYTMAWVGLAEHNREHSVFPVAHAGFNSHYIETAEISWSLQPNGLGPAGMAIRTGTVQVENSIRTAPSMEPWRNQALYRDYLSVICLPLQDKTGTFGVVTLYAPEEGWFDDDLVAVLTVLAGKMSLAVERLRETAYKHLIGKL